MTIPMALRSGKFWHYVVWSLAAVILAPIGLLIAFILYFVFVDSCSESFSARNASLTDLTFDFVSYQCGFFGSVEIQAFKISRGPGLVEWFGKTTILEYQGTPDVPPTVSRIDSHTIRISVEDVSNLGFAKESWQGLNILYDIRRRDPKSYDLKPWTPGAAEPSK